MDLTKPLERIELEKVLCLHDVAIKTGYGGEVKHVLVFIEPSTLNSYVWTTSSVNASLYQVGKQYHIKGLLDKVNRRLSFVKPVDYKYDGVDLDQDMIDSWHAQVAGEKVNNRIKI